MKFDAELLKQLIESFSIELDEHVLAITNGLLELEKNNLNDAKKNQLIEVIFRSAHNIKGTARSLGIIDVSDIAHRIETLFSEIQKKNKSITPDAIDICLNAVDEMRAAFANYLQASRPSGTSEAGKQIDNKPQENIKPKKTTKQTINHSSKKTESHEHDLIRVPIHKIDKVSSLVEEVQVNKIAIMDHYSDLSKLVTQTTQFSYLWKQFLNAMKSHPEINSSVNIQRIYETISDCFGNIKQSSQEMHKNMRSQINDLTLLTHSLQEEVGLMRMVPMGNLFCTFPRYVRDLARELNKKVTLNIKGEEVKIDKAVLDGLKDSMIHLLRNAIDHGIESPNTRKNLGKPEEGKINILIQEEEGFIKISLTDDGAGIDLSKISRVAENKKIYTKNEIDKMSEEEKFDIIFHSGFSTKEIITDVSGRGVGLDVVKSNIEGLKGYIYLSTELGKSTTFTLNVPVSITGERGLLVKCTGHQFVIPASSVEHVLMKKIDDIVNVQGNQAILLEQRTLPLRYLANVLQLGGPGNFSEEKIPIVVIKKGWQSVALLVDEIVGEKEIVIKPLPEPLPKIPCVAGGTLLESNQVIVVLEPSSLITYSMAQTKMGHVKLQKDTSKKTERPHILVVDDSITTRTLEKTVLESKNYQVTVAVNGKEAWEILQHQKFSLMITDITMPVMDGFTLTEQVKKSAHLHDLPVIIVTSLGSESEKKRGIDVGADAYIVKSEFESGVLLDIVSQFV